MQGESAGEIVRIPATGWRWPIWLGSSQCRDLYRVNVHIRINISLLVAWVATIAKRYSECPQRKRIRSSRSFRAPWALTSAWSKLDDLELSHVSKESLLFAKRSGRTTVRDDS